jgi:hypothetical protein
MRSHLATAFLVTLIGCSSADGSASGDSTDGGGDDTTNGGQDTAHSDGGGGDSVTTNDAHTDAPTADTHVDAVAPAAPSCPAADRAEFTGTIPGTVIAVAVCSACGESYVVAASGSATAAEVTLDNGTAPVAKTSIPAKGTVTTGKLADKSSDGSITVCGTSDGAHGCLPTSPKNLKYCDPFRDIKSLRAERIDQGVDYGGSGPIYAMGPGTIDVYRNRTDSGWPGNTFMSYKMTDGPASGKTIYLAENIDLNTALKSGSYVWNGTVLGTLVNASPDSETGWGVPGAGYTAEYTCYVEGCSTSLGFNFNDLLKCVGTPSGISTGTTGCCPAAPSSYPATWCDLIDKWQ